jgi:hypothetical protein
MTTDHDHDHDLDDDTYRVVGITQQIGMLDTIILLAAYDSDDQLVQIAADHRPAGAILEALYDGEEPIVYSEPWAVTRLPADFPILVPSTHETV